eukprot:TRINITY_DN869_c1_g1_i1.p1 TRINITY_DN869_c1_g1~~TRINITY_DN869_c1_g1_i1.p1  ORF type:complete len:108 (-),score=22.13 TRINITY_DN869_c1_g1_i1:12-335(-)
MEDGMEKEVDVRDFCSSFFDLLHTNHTKLCCFWQALNFCEVRIIIIIAPSAPFALLILLIPRHRFLLIVNIAIHNHFLLLPSIPSIPFITFITFINVSFPLSFFLHL